MLTYAAVTNVGLAGLGVLCAVLISHYRKDMRPIFRDGEKMFTRMFLGSEWISYKERLNKDDLIKVIRLRG